MSPAFSVFIAPDLWNAVDVFMENPRGMRAPFKLDTEALRQVREYGEQVVRRIADECGVSLEEAQRIIIFGDKK